MNNTSVDQLATLTSPHVDAEISITYLLCCHDLHQLEYKHFFCTNVFVILVILYLFVILKGPSGLKLQIVKGLSCLFCLKGVTGLKGLKGCKTLEVKRV